MGAKDRAPIVYLVSAHPLTHDAVLGRTYPVSRRPELAALLQEQREATTALVRAEGRIAPCVFHRPSCNARQGHRLDVPSARQESQAGCSATWGARPSATSS